MKRRDCFARPLILSTTVWIIAAGCRPDRVPQPEHVDDSEHAAPLFKQIEEKREIGFRIHWPPLDPTNQQYQSRPPLLMGTLLATIGSTNETQDQFQLWVQLNRSSTDEDRIRWNRQLAFPEYDWMSKVRVWDTEHQWIWPNLPYLLRAYGNERTERYGGMDPGKKVDNDFAAVVVRCFDSNGQPWNVESTSPLVSAEWHGPSGDASRRTTIVHQAKSDVFRLDLDREPTRDKASGTLKIWLIFADFMDSPVPPQWPKQREFDGGILSYFALAWTTVDDHKKIVSMECVAPETDTQFDWAQWVSDGKPRRVKQPQEFPKER